MVKPRKRIRLPELLVSRGLAADVYSAEKLILAGLVQVDGVCLDKVGTEVTSEAALQLTARSKFVSRGGDKLEAALSHFGINLNGKVVLDIGSSTGGFSDCMLQHGAKKIYAVDVGTNQLDWKLRNDPRVVVLEQTNARYAENLLAAKFSPPPDFATIDVSFISATEMLNSISKILPDKASCLILVKPHFELEKEAVDKGGVVLDQSLRMRACSKVSLALSENGWRVAAAFESPLRGEKGGNVEYFLFSERG